MSIAIQNMTESPNKNQLTMPKQSSKKFSSRLEKYNNT